MDVFHSIDKNYDLTIYCDGSSFQGPPGTDGTGGLGFIIYDRRGQVLHSRSQVVPDADNNEAEVRAIMEALRTARDFASGRVKVYTDSATARRLLEHDLRPYTAEIRSLVSEADQLRSNFKRVVIKQVPRRFNKVADGLSRLTLKLFRSHGRTRPKRFSLPWWGGK